MNNSALASLAAVIASGATHAVIPLLMHGHPLWSIPFFLVGMALGAIFVCDRMDENETAGSGSPRYD